MMNMWIIIIFKVLSHPLILVKSAGSFKSKKQQYILGFVTYVKTNAQKMERGT